MSKTVIKVENLSKQYRLGQVGTGTISHDLNRWWHRVRGKEDPYLKVGESNNRASKGNSEYVWALQDINFEVKQGEILGIIGKNGAGKSTLLKVLSKVTGPTTGSIKAKGRIASLLEVGTGFHPELTGRENIFLNGTILGMTKAEVKAKLDEIVAFAGVERYLDTPVKRYSSGMMVRLGFAVAAHLEPEILIVDEVLAVGDAEFQKKAIGKMKEVSLGQGKTVLFVSHNMGSIENLCPNSILLKDGRIVVSGNTSEVISTYLKKMQVKESAPLINIKERSGVGDIIFSKIDFLDQDGKITNFGISGRKLIFKLNYFSKNKTSFNNCRLSILIKNNEHPLIILSSELTHKSRVILQDKGVIQFEVNRLPLSKGLYNLSFFMESDKIVQDFIENGATLEVVDGDFYGNGKNYPLGWEGRTVLIDQKFSN